MDWDGLVENQLNIDRELPALSGFVGVLPEEDSKTNDPVKPEHASVDPVAPGPLLPEVMDVLDVNKPNELSGTGRTVLFPVVLACGALLVGVLLVGFFILRK